MNTKELTIELLLAFQNDDKDKGGEILDQLWIQTEKEFEKSGGLPIIPEEIFLLLNPPNLRSIAYFSFLRILETNL